MVPKVLSSNVTSKILGQPGGGGFESICVRMLCKMEVDDDMDNVYTMMFVWEQVSFPVQQI
jgi:hypothetical protein